VTFLDTLLQFLRQFWPFEIVHAWERGVYLVFGRVWKASLKPGLYPFMPFFTQLMQVSMVPEPFSTPLLNIVLADGVPLSYSVTAVVRVSDPMKALVAIDRYKDSIAELLASKTSEKLGEQDSTRFEVRAGGRGRLLSDLTRWCNEESQQYGVEVLALRLTNFVLKSRINRLLLDSSLVSKGLEG